MANPDGGDVSQIVNYCIAFNNKYMIFFWFLSLKNQIIVVISTPFNSNLITEA